PLDDLQPNSNSTTTIVLDSIIKPLGMYGTVQCHAIVTHPQDGRRDNDTLRLTSYSSYPKGTLLINEIMFDPSAGNVEFIELYNTSDFPIDVAGYVLRDASPAAFLLPPCMISAKGFGVLAFDTVFYNQFPELRGKPNVAARKSPVSLNSDDDAVILRDPVLRTQDSLMYASSWHIGDLAITKGISLEKLSPTLATQPRSSWTSSADKRGCTPLEMNSVAREIDKLDLSLTASPNPFSPRSTDAKRQATVISYSLPFAQARCFATIYDANGLKVMTLGNSEYSGATGNFTWDGRNTEGYMLDAGPYVFVIEALDLQTQQSYKRSILIAIGE
ncbi:MAG: lamin tail domain-containing protein, partial [Candidatus Kapabacteria bacterium]|nr:lamin tail domain-containing protein [Candidatus Kapabacteria bacterium]